MNQIINATRTLRYTLAVCLSLLLSACNLDKTVDYVDIPSYMGLWYQISANEVSFNEGLVGVTAEYTLLDDGSVEVHVAGPADTVAAFLLTLRGGPPGSLVTRVSAVEPTLDIPKDFRVIR